MADKDDRSGGARRAEGSEDSRRVTPPARAAQRDTGEGQELGSAHSKRRGRYLLGARRIPGTGPLAPELLSMQAVVDYLGRQDNVQIIRRIKLGSAQSILASSATPSEVLVVEIDESKAERLRAAAPQQLIIERDAPLIAADYYASAPLPSSPIGTLLSLRAVSTELLVRVIGERDQPLARAMVIVDAGLPACAVTDESGTARITLFGDSLESVRALLVRASANHWDRLIQAPQLRSGVNTVRLRPLSDLRPNFPGERAVGWGQRLMKLDPTSGRYTGEGVRIGLIDSGCDNTHPLLRHITRGKDLLADSESSWSSDPLSHGTHCAGILNAALTPQGVVGCAPEAELHVLKVLPQGHTSDLLAALDECIARELDVVQLGVVTHPYSELVAQKLGEARLKGIACIVPVGNSGGALGFPAMVPGVMAVGAVGRLREFPADSSHMLSLMPQLMGPDEVFAASFSSVGLQVAVSAPGVAILSTVPGNGYAASDGTCAAAAHVAGFAALLLAHHPVLQEDRLGARSEQRVQALFELIRASAVPRFADPLRGGAGVPDLQRVPTELGFAPPLAGAERNEGLGLAPWPFAAPEWSSIMQQMRAAGFA